ncbi:hypothetical protein BDQ12DRAFT_713241 [Crucibulum laeve]|uniref:Uncharacterized protein n=1 Tax=Crucibulum laeve TaxID=68775 RepID=A0A5C3LYT1_9AGAR|nr:hypothetical protein BDQ12DRAFT_713241 [Crucibulum laeve]
MDKTQFSPADPYLTKFSLPSMPLPINNTEEDIVYAYGLQTSNYFYALSTEWSIPKVLYFFARYYPLIQTGCESNQSTGINAEDIGGTMVLPQWWICPDYSSRTCYILPASERFVREYTQNCDPATTTLPHRDRGQLLFTETRLTFMLMDWLQPELVTTTRIAIIVARNTYQAPLPGCQSKADAELVSSLYAFQLLGWIPPLCVGLILFVLTMIKFRNTVPAPTKMLGISGVKALINPDVSSPVFASLFRDGAIYFLVIFVVVLADTIPQLGGLSSYLSPYFVAVYSISIDALTAVQGSRLVLNLRKIATENTAQVEDASTSIVFSTFAARSTQRQPTRDELESF